MFRARACEQRFHSSLNGGSTSSASTKRTLTFFPFTRAVSFCSEPTRVQSGCGMSRLEHLPGKQQQHVSLRHSAATASCSRPSAEIKRQSRSGPLRATKLASLRLSLKHVTRNCHYRHGARAFVIDASRQLGGAIDIFLRQAFEERCQRSSWSGNTNRCNVAPNLKSH